MNLFVSMLGYGLITSVHCVFMCGGLVLTYAVKGAQDGPWPRRLLPHLAYQGAKIASYATVALVLGVVVAVLGRATDISGFRNWLMVVAGVYMVLLGLGMTGRLPALAYLSPRPPRFLVKALSRNRRKATADAGTGHVSLATPLAFGALTGLMPCAPLIAAQAAAVSSGSPVSGAAAMVGFGLGTAPLMLLFGFGSSLLSKAFQKRLQIVAALAVMIFGLVILNRGLMLVGSPVTFDTLKVAVVGGPRTGGADGFSTGTDGVVEVPVTIRDTTYIPQDVVIPADSPVRLVVDRQEDSGCSDQLAIPAARVLADLTPNGVTRVDVPPMKAGSYTLTCGMGMMSGSIVAVAAAGAAAPAPGATPAIAIAALLLTAAALATYAWRRRDRARADRARCAVPVAADGGRTYAGLRPVELVIALMVIAAAILLGLALGGYFH